MFVSNKLLGLFAIAKESVDELRHERDVLRVERDLLKAELTSSKITSDWLRMKVNQLEIERVGLLEVAYGIKTAAPEIVRRPVTGYEPYASVDFNDIGDQEAMKLGLPLYGDKQTSN